MMIIAYVPFVVMLVGAIMFVLAKRGDFKEIGRLLFFCGLFFVLYSLSGRVWRIG